MSNKKLAGIIAGCTIAIIVAILLIIFPPGRPLTPSSTTYTLSVSVSPSGAGSVSPSGGEYESGAQVTLTVSPASGYTFDHWSGSASGTTSTITITMDSAKSLTANFRSTPTPTPTSITIALDYFGVRNTHWISQVGGQTEAKIQLVVLIRDEQKNLATFTIPQEGVDGFGMDFFQVNALKDYRDPKVFTGTATGSLTFSIAAYNVNKGPITKAQIDAISKWTGADFSAIKDLIPDKEFVGSCWHTWSASENFGVGSDYTLDDGNLKVWLRVGSNQAMPDPVPRPVLKPNVEIVGKLPTDVRARTEWVYNEKPFTFTVTNHESFEFPIYWHLETDSNPGNEINWWIYPTEGELSISGGGSKTITYPYWFWTPGTYMWKYVAEYPKGNPVASWDGTLTVAR
ncbi:MAG: hypothetical protein DRI01_04405 [Chloroflexi bacterium]|nr:MAG: hypothetical protein DRI01_04405 [Chloroflexota bacterium]